MKCTVKRDETGKLVGVLVQDRKNPDSTKTDPLYQSILDKVTKDPQSYIDTDEFIRGLYGTNLLVDVTKEEIALGIWAKVHQFWINTNTSLIEKPIPVEDKALTPKDEAYFPPMPEGMPESSFENTNNDRAVDSVLFDNILLSDEKIDQLTDQKIFVDYLLNPEKINTIEDAARYVLYFEDKDFLNGIENEPIFKELKFKLLPFDHIKGDTKSSKKKLRSIHRKNNKMKREAFLTLISNKNKKEESKNFLQKIIDLIKSFLHLEKETGYSKFEELSDRIIDNYKSGNLNLKEGNIESGYEKIDFQKTVNSSKIASYILGKFDNKDFSLTGSLAYSPFGNIYRDPNNILHDIDIVTNYNGEESNSKILEKFPNAIKIYDIPGNNMLTYIIPLENHTVQNIQRRNEDGSLVTAYDVVDENGKTVGTFKLEYDIDEESGDIINRKEIKKGEEATFVDIFYNNSIEENQISEYKYNNNGKESIIWLNSYLNGFTAKYKIGRDKDKNDILLFKKESNLKGFQSNTLFQKSYNGYEQDLNIRNKYFPNSNSTDVKTILKQISINSHSLNKLASKLSEYSDINNVQIELVPDYTSLKRFYENEENQLDWQNIMGLYSDKENKIFIVENATFIKGYSEPTILHEILHAITYNELRTNNSFSRELNKLYNYALDKLDPEYKEGKFEKSHTYGLTNLDEFIVGLFTSSTLMKQLEKVEALNGKKYKNLFEEIFAYLLNILKLDKRNSLYSQAFALSTQIIDSAKLRKENNLSYNNDMFESLQPPVNESNPSEEILNTNLVDEIFQEYDDFIEGFEEFENMRSFGNLNDQIEKNIKFTEKRLSELRRQKRELKKGDSDKNKELNEKIARQERKKEEYNSQLQKAKNLNGLTAIEEMADKVLEEYRSMLSSDELSLTDLDHVNNNIRFWLAVGTLDPYKREHILYGDEELSEDMRSRLGSIGVKATDIYNQYIEKQLNAMQKEIFKKLKGEKKYLIDQLTETKDITWWQQNTLDISTYGDAVLALIQVHEKEAVTAAQVKIAELVNKLEAAFDPVKNRLGKNYDIFQQKNADGSKTNRLVYRFTPEFFEAARDARFKLQTNRDYAKFIEWLDDNEIIMNPIILFPTKLGDEYHWGQSENMYSDYDENMREKHIQELKDTLGEKDFEMYRKSMEEKISNFIFQYNETKADLIGQGLSGEDLETALKDWELQKSPYYFVQRALHGKKLENSQGIIVKNDGYSYVNTVPRRFKKDGSETGYYDKNYENIQSDPKLAELYNQILEITSELSDMLPSSKRKELGINGLPFLRKDISELFGRGNVIGMTEGLYEQFIEMTRSKAFEDTDSQERDPITGRVKFKARLHLETEEQAVKDMVESKWIRYTIENTADMKKMSKIEKQLLKERITKEFKKQVVTEMQKERSDDLMTTMKAYIMATVMYHHKSNIEDMLNIISQIAEDRSAFVTKDGVIQIDKKTGKPKLAEHAEKKREALRYNLEVFLTGKARATEGQTKKKILTKGEKAREKELKDLLETLEQKFLANEITEKFYSDSKAELDAQIANLGGVLEGSKVGDMALKLVQLKGIGWNVLSGLNNMAFGYVANSTEAAAAEHFDDPSLAKSRRMLTSSAVTNMTFNHYRNAESKKIRKMIDLFDILKDASSELFKAGNKSPIASKFRWLGAYQANKRTEYINQGQTFIAYMLFNKIKDLNGKEFSMWEAFDDNGVWKTEQFGEMDMSKFSQTKTSVDQLIKRLHGNYDELSPVMGKRTIAGRALFQFKSWFPETWRKYWGKETPDFILGDNYKGRYLSAIDAFSTDWKKTTGATVAEFLKKYMNVTSFGLIKNFSDPNAFSHLTKVDMMNMRRNIHQLIFMANLTMLYYLLKYLADDDGEDKLFDASANLAIHQISRLTGELEMYSSPTDLADFSKNLFPASVIIKDLSEIITAVGKSIGGDAYMQSGTYKDWHRVPKEVFEGAPFLAPAMNTYKIFSGESQSKEATLIEAAIGE